MKEFWRKAEHKRNRSASMSLRNQIPSVFLLQDVHLELTHDFCIPEIMKEASEKAREMLPTAGSGLFKKPFLRFHTTFFIHILLTRN